MQGLNQDQHDVVTAEDNLLCCACPGSGKTRVLVEKVKYVLSRHHDAKIILTTFSRDATNEMRERLSRALSPSLMRKLTVGTFHALALRQLKAIGTAGHVLNTIETNHIILRALEETGVFLSLDEAELVIATCKIDPAYAEENPKAARLTHIYQRELAARGACDFVDIIALANTMMADGRLSPLPATHVFCDEYQDIDRLQYEWLLHHIAGARQVCVVGDADQCIYGFRRSLGYRGMMDFVAITGARIITLGANYRSTSRILSHAGRLIGHNLDRVKMEMTAVRGDGHAPQLIRVANQDEQINHIIETLEVLCRDNPVPEPLDGRQPFRFGVNKGQAAVLARTNRQLLTIERKFIESRIPYLRAGRSLWDDQILPQVFVSLLQSLHARNSVGIEVALRWACIPDSLIRTLSDRVGGNLWTLLDPNRAEPDDVPGGPIVESLVKLGRGWARKLGDGSYSDSAAQGVIYGVAAWMENVMKGTCGHDADDGDGDRSKTQNIKDLWMVGVVKDTLDVFRGNLPQRIALARQDERQNIPRVILSTFHAAKGLEWDNVFIIDLVQGSVPKCGPEASDMEIEEERRVFYVAMTRARDRLYLYTYLKKNGAYSEFLTEAGFVAPQAQPQASAQTVCNA
jgi:superfamily I DNA/RNA helicase